MVKRQKKELPPVHRFEQRQRRSRGEPLPKEVKANMTVRELHQIAKSLGIAYAGLNKANLIKKINFYL